jgi:hypothetical protein
MMVYQEKILPPGPLPVLGSEPPEVLLSQRTIESLELEKAWLKERLAPQLAAFFSSSEAFDGAYWAHFGSAVMSDLSPGCADCTRPMPLRQLLFATVIVLADDGDRSGIW